MTSFRETSEIRAEINALQVQRAELDQQINELHQELAAARQRAESEKGVEGVGVIGQWLSTEPDFKDLSAGLKQRQWQGGGHYRNVTVAPYVYVNGYQRKTVKTLYRLSAGGNDFKNSPPGTPYLRFQLDLFRENNTSPWGLIYDITANASTHNRKPRMAPANIQSVDEAQKWAREMGAKQLASLRKRLMKKANG